MKFRLFNFSVIISLLISLLGGAVTFTPARAAGIVVNSSADVVANDGVCTLREAITNANGDSQLFATAGECAAGSGADTITFADDYTITLTAELPTTSSNITISGAGRSVTIQGNNTQHMLVNFSGGTLTIDTLTISEMFSSASGATGGAIGNAGTLNVNNSFFSDNRVTGASFGGGAILNYSGTTTINNSIFTGNAANTSGGAIQVFSGTVTIHNSTFVNNTAGTFGGGVHVSGGSANIINVTFLDNAAGNGGSVYNESGTITLKNSLLATDIFGMVNCGGTITAGTDNIATDTTCNSATPVDFDQLKIGTLGNYGGNTQTIPLLPDSPAIDAGDAATCAAAPINGLDQRGVARPFGAGCDVGAYEYDGSAPTVTITPASYYANEQVPLNLHGTGISVNDLDGDPLTVTIEAANIFSELTASVGTTGVVIASGNGTPNLELTGTIAQLNDLFAGNSGGTLTFLLDDDTPPATVMLSMIADDGIYSGNDSATINITAVNDSPVNTVPSAQTTNEDTALVFSSANGNQLSIADADVSSNNLEITLSVTNGTLTLAGITGLSFTTGDGTADGTLVFTGSLADINNALATLTFNPTANYNGAAVLSITSSDQGFNGTGGVLTDTDTVNITVNTVNDTPVVVNPIPNQNATEDSLFNFQFAANTFNDLDIGDTLTYSAQLAGGGALPGWLSFDGTTRTFSGTPANGDVGTITIQVTANDGSQSVSDNFDLTIANTNDAPVIANPIPNQNAFENTSFNYQFPINAFSDPDVGDTLNYTAQLAGGGAIPLWLSFDSVTRTFSGTPSNADIGTVTIDVTANDGNGGTVTDTFNIVVGNANNAPFVANPIPNQTATEDVIFNFQFSATTFSDPDVGDILSYSAQLAGGGALPGWLSFDAVTRTFSGIPTNGDVGTITIQVNANDGSQSVADNFDLMVMNTNDAPVIDNPIPDQNAFENTLFNYQFPANTFSDPDVGDTLVYSAQLAGGGVLPGWLSFDGATRTFSGTPSNGDIGTISIDVVASDGNGGSVADTFNIIVSAQTNPVVTQVNVTNANGNYTIGDQIFVTITFDQNVNVDTSGGTPTILLETGSIDRTASYVAGSGTDTLTFIYTVQPGDQTPDLDYASINALVLNGALIRSAANADAALSLPNVGGANSIAGQHNIVINGTTFTVAATTLQAVYTATGPTFFAVTFSENVSNSGGGSNSDDVTNPANYLLVEEGVNGIFDTTSCVSGFNPNDTLVNISNVSYVPNTAVVTLSSALTVGNYRLFVCGTTSIVDFNGLPLSGDGITPGTDYVFDVVVNTTSTGNPTEPETEITSASTLPKTGFAPNKITALPPQPATLEYAKLDDIMLEIPSLNVKSSIVGVPQTNGDWDVTWLGNDTGWLNGTAFPTWNGNSVLTAHVTNASGLEGPFVALKSLRYGDQIIVHFGGVKYVYEVRNSRLVRPYSTGFAFESLPEHSYITLITCQGYNPLNDTYLFRRVVRAVLVEVR